MVFDLAFLKVVLGLRVIEGRGADVVLPLVVVLGMSVVVIVVLSVVGASVASEVVDTDGLREERASSRSI